MTKIGDVLHFWGQSRVRIRFESISTYKYLLTSSGHNVPGYTLSWLFRLDLHFLLPAPHPGLAIDLHCFREPSPKVINNPPCKRPGHTYFGYFWLAFTSPNSMLRENEISTRVLIFATSMYIRKALGDCAGGSVCEANVCCTGFSLHPGYRFSAENV